MPAYNIYWVSSRLLPAGLLAHGLGSVAAFGVLTYSPGQWSVSCDVLNSKTRASEA